MNVTAKEAARRIREHNKIHQRAEPRNSPIITEILEVAAVLFEKIDSEEYQIVKHGRWIRGASKGWPTNPSCLWYCSCCGEKIRYVDTLRTYQKIKKPVNEVNPYCRKCGAKMDGGDSE